MADPLAAPAPINSLISVAPLVAAAPERDAGTIPPQLAGLAVGAVVEGFVVNRDPKNNPVLRTPLGDLVIQSDLFLKTGSEVVFRIDATQASRARIVTIDGFSPADYAAQQTRAPTADSISQTPLPTGAPPQAPVNAGKAPAAPPPLDAVLLTPAASAKPASSPTMPPASVQSPATAAAAAVRLPPMLASLPAGTPLQISVQKILLPAALAVQEIPDAASTGQPIRVPAQPVAGAPITGNPPTPAAAASSRPPVPAASAPLNTSPSVAAPDAALANSPPPATESPFSFSSSAAPQASAAPLPPSPLSVQTPPNAPAAASFVSMSAVPPLPTLPVVASPGADKAPATTPGLSPNSLPMTVIGHEANGATILHSPMGTIQAYLPQKLPVGTRIQAEVTLREPTAAGAASATPLASDPMQEITSLASDWKSLSDAVTYLQTNNPPLAAQLTQQLPQVGNQLTSGLLFFLAAVKNGDPRQWLGGRVMAALDAASPAVAGKLRADMAQLQQFSAEAPKGNWSVVMLPMMMDGQLEQARLFFRQDREPAQGLKKGGSNHRFILEVDLSQMGSMQLDGFVRKTEKKHQFDLVIRSARPLSPQVSNDIRALFENSVAAAGFGGYLAFQQGSQYFVRPMANVQAATGAPGEDSDSILA